MGIFDRLRGKSMEDPVRGIGTVVKINDGKPGDDLVKTDALFTRCVLHLTVSAEGLEPTTVEWKGLVKAHKWPRRGVKLPVTVDRADPERVEILWDEAPSVAKNLLGGTMADLSSDQVEKTERIQAKVMENQAELLKITQQFRDGEIDQDELMRRQSEIMGDLN